MRMNAELTELDAPKPGEVTEISACTSGTSRWMSRSSSSTYPCM